MSDREDLVAEFELNSVELEAEYELSEGENFDALFTINLTPDKVSQLENDLNFQTATQVQEAIQAESNIINTRIDNEVERLEEELAKDLANKQDVLTAGENIQIENNVISATNTTYTAGEGISIVDNVISNTQKSGEWGNIEGDIANQTDLIDLIDTKIDIEATARENNDLSLQNGINTLNDDLTAEISNRGTADGILQGNIDTLSGTVSDNYTTLDGKIGDNKTAIDNHIADKTNPHEVTKSQVGLGNVDNTSDLNKPISTATQNALDGKVPTSRTVNSKALTSDITLTASDVDALPDTTTINDLTTAEQQSALNSGANSTNIGQIATNTQAILTEATNRQNADNNLQSQIDALVVASDVFDIVGTYAELQTYDISTVPVNDIIKVLVDSTHNNAATYYRCVENDNVKSWSYIGAEGAYFTKSEADGRFVEQTTTINGQALSNNITLTASDVGALPDSTTIGNGTLTIQKNGTTIDTFGANDTGNTTVNITVPTDTGDLTNNAGYIKDINRTDVTTALGYTPYDSTNPDGYTDNVGTVTSVNNTQPDTNGNVTISIPAAQVNSDWNASSGVAQILNKPTLSTVATSGSYNDLSDKPTIPTVGNGTITINQGGVQKGTFTTNQSGNTTIDLDSGGSDIEVDDELSTTSENPVQNKVITGALNDKQDVILDLSTIRSGASKGATAVQPNDLSTVATSGSYNDLADKPTIPSAVTESTVSDWGFTKNTGTVTSVNNVQPVNGNVTLSIPEQVQANWNETDSTSKAYIQNKPTIPDTSTFEKVSNKVTSISSSSTNTQYPSAKCVYDNLASKLDASTYTSNPRTNAVYITETYHSGSSWYRVWSDGFIEQGGIGTGGTSNSGAKVNLLKNYSSDNYLVLAHCTINATSINNASIWIKTFNKSISGFYQGTGYTGASSTAYSSYPFSWYACGY